MDETITIPVVADLQDVKGLQELSSKVNATILSSANRAIAQLKSELDIPGIVPPGIGRLEQIKQEAKHYSGRTSTYASEIQQLRGAGLTTSTAEQYLASNLGLRKSFRSLTNKAPEEAINAETAKSISFEQEQINRRINLGRSLLKAEEARNAFLSSEEIGGDIKAFFENTKLSPTERLKKAREALKLETTAYNLGEQTGLLSESDKKQRKETITYLSDIAESSDKTAQATAWTAKIFGASPLAAMMKGGSIGKSLSNAAESWYANRNDPYTQRRRWMADLGKDVGMGIGGLIGAGVGALIGGGLTLLTGGAAAPLLPYFTGGGAAAGGGAGSWLGGSKKRNIERAESSQLDAIEMLRWRSLYGNTGSGNQMFAKMAAKTGYVTEGDIEDLAASKNTFMAAAAFGGISESHWLGLSMMPNYFAALASGADEATLLAAYQKDMEMLGPGMGQYITSLVPGLNENIRALVNNRDQFGSLLGDVAFASDAESVIVKSGLARGLESAQYYRGRQDVNERIKIMGDAADTEDRNQFDWEAIQNVEAAKNAALSLANTKLSGEKETPSDKLAKEIKKSVDDLYLGTKGASSTKYDLNIIVNGDKTTLGTVAIDNADLRQWSTFNYTIGAQ